VTVKPALQSGRQLVVFTIYATAVGGTPLATEQRSVLVDATGSFAAPLGSLNPTASAPGDERWLGVQVMPRAEARRVRIAGDGSRRLTVQVVTDAAITANGIIESISQGFRFPDGSVQTSAATPAGGVPSVNGIGSALTINGGGGVLVGTAGNTITVTGPAFGTPVAVAAANAQGVASTVARSDHAHAHGNQAGGTLHAAATTSTGGFLSASDKTKLNGTVAYVRTITVSPVVGNPTASGTALTTALNGITGNSAAFPYLLKIEPGVYDIGSIGLTMKSFVDIEGSGQNATFITATCGFSLVSGAAAAVTGAADSEIRNLTITNTSASLVGIGFFSAGSGTRRISNVTINSTGGTDFSYGVFSRGTLTTTTTLIGSRMTVTATGVGGASSTSGLTGWDFTIINIIDSTFTGKGIGGTGTNTGVEISNFLTTTIDSSTIVGTGVSNGNFGILVSQGTVTVTNSTVRADTGSLNAAMFTDVSATAIATISNSRLLANGPVLNSSQLSLSRNGSSTMRVATSLVDSASFGSPTCVHVYNSVFASLGTTCPPAP
jgi:hypothetical protein